MLPPSDFGQWFWRDARIGLGHAIHTPGTIYRFSALTAMGVEVPAALRAEPLTLNQRVRGSKP